MSAKPITTYGGTPWGAELETPGERKAASRAAAIEEGEREMAYMAALGRTSPAPPPLPQLRTPLLPNDFKERITERDAAVVKRGIAVDRDKLVLIGKECFAKLLAADQEARNEQGVVGVNTDLTSWPSVEQGFAMAGALQVSSVPQRRMKEIARGAGKDREAVSRIAGFEDLWKSTSEPRAVRAVYEFHDRFVALAFAKSMLERIGDDGRARSSFFCGGHGRKVKLFNDWRGVLKGQLANVRLRNVLWSLVAWLTDEQAQSPVARELAREFYGCRAPDSQQIATIEALRDGFALGYNEWALWQFVGRRTRSVQPLPEQLAEWRNALARRYRCIENFFVQLRGAFLRSVGGNAYDAHMQLDQVAFRSFVDTTIRNLSNVVSAVVGLTIEAASDGALVARFDDWWLFESQAPKFLEARIRAVRSH